MRAFYALGSIFTLGMVLYAVGNFAAISIALNVPGDKPEPPPKPLEEAAPEVVQLRDDFRRLAMQALAHVPLCVHRDEEEDSARPRGRVLIWDVDQNDVSLAHGCLSAELRLASLDQPCTIYLITDRERTHVMDYSYDIFHGGGPSGVKGFRTDLAVCAIDYPTLAPRGRYWIRGNGPPTYTELKEDVKEIDENWAGNLKRWIDTCVQGPPPRYTPKADQAMHRHGDAARELVDDCELLGSLPTLGRVPPKAMVYNLQTDRWHPANGYFRARADASDEELLMVLPLADELVVDQQRRTGRIDYRVAVVVFPGAEPLGVYQVRGEDWRLPQMPGETWAGEDRNKHDVKKALARWVERLCEVNRGLPEGTIPVAAEATHLGGTEWLKGPGWLKRMPGTTLTPTEQAWEKMAEACEPAVADCRAMGEATPRGKLPTKIVVWMDHAECFSPSPAQKALPKSLQAGANDKDVLMVLIVGSDFVQEPKDVPKWERFDHDVALFTMPGATPVGLYRIRGEELASNRPRMGPGAKNADTSKDIADWLTRFVESNQ